jgi:hypothetical protein
VRRGRFEARRPWERRGRRERRRVRGREGKKDAAGEREKKSEFVIFFRVWGIYTPTRSGVRVSIAAHREPSLRSH